MKKTWTYFIFLFALLFIPNIALAKTIHVDNYDDLKNAIVDALAEDYIIVDSDIQLTDVIVVNKNLTLDLNGNKLIGSNRNFAIKSSKDLIIKNGTVEGVYGGLYSTDGILTLQNLLVTGSDSLISVTANSVVTIDKDSSVIATGKTPYPAIQITGSYTEADTYNPYLHIYGKVLSGDETAILGNGRDKNISHIYIYDSAIIESKKLTFYFPQPCDMNISGGRITSSEGSIFGIKSGNINISGGVLTSNGNHTDDDLETSSNGIATSGHLIHIDSNGSYLGKVSINISGNPILKSSHKGIVKEVGLEEDLTGITSILITGGTFHVNQEYSIIDVRNATKDKVFITGGTFNVKVDEQFIASGYIQNKNTDDTYTISVPVQNVDIITNSNYVNTMKDEKLKGILLSTLKKSDIDVTSRDVMVEIDIDENKEPSETIKNQISKTIKNLTITNYFDISIVVKDSATDATLGQLPTLEDKIALTVTLPKNMKKVPDGYNRNYYIVRIHDDKVDLLDAVLSEDGKGLIFESDKFSIYAIAYKDVLKEITNPNTYDGIIDWIVIGLISSIGMIGCGYYLNKKYISIK